MSATEKPIIEHDFKAGELPEHQREDEKFLYEFFKKS
jgi:hypothetical protein